MQVAAALKRMKELGIRVALGARKTQVMSAAVCRRIVLLGVGSMAVLLWGIFTNRLLGQIVYQANPRDPVVVGGAVLTMGLIGIAASAVAARRTLAVDPSKLMSATCLKVVDTLRLCLGLLVWRIYLSRVNYLVRKTQQLETIVSQRTAEVRAALFVA
jgi:hypothetical protein